MYTHVQSCLADFRRLRTLFARDLCGPGQRPGATSFDVTCRPLFWLIFFFFFFFF